MAVYGLTNEGFIIKTLSVIRDELNALLRQAFGASVQLGDQAIIGQMVGIISEMFSKLWELGEAVNSGKDVDSASGAALDQLCLLTGTLRPQASYSAVDLTLTGTNGTVIPAGSKVVTLSTDVEFETTDAATLATVPTWTTATAYVAGDRVTFGTSAYHCITAGTSHATTGPIGPPDFNNPSGGAVQPFTNIVDGTVHWVYLGEGAAVEDVTAKATETGPISVVAYDIHDTDSIVTQVSGWNGVTNLDDASPGRNAATDAELRILREQELQTGGSSPLNALRAELLEVPDVVAVTIFQNVTDTTDADGIPPHSIEALVRGPDTPTVAFDQSIFDALLAGVAAGIRTHATTPNDVVGTATDDEGTAHTMKFTRPEEVDIYVAVTLIKDPDEYPLDGDDQVKEVIVAYGDEQATGKNVVSSALIGAIFREVPGVLDVTACLIDDAPAPATSTTVPISLRQLAVYSTTRITVSSSNGVP